MPPWVKLIHLFREGSLLMGWGAGNNGNLYNSRKSPYLRKTLFTHPFIFPKESKIIDGQKLFAPLNDASIFFATRQKNFAPPLRLKNYVSKMP